MSINTQLVLRWMNYFEAKKELEMVYKELLSDSFAAKAQGDELPGITLVKPHPATDMKAAIEYAKTQGWELPMYQPELEVDTNKLKVLFKEKNVKIPCKEMAGSARLKGSKDEKED